MNVNSPLAYPAAGTLSAWWRQLAPQQPHAGWVAHLFCHRVEAVVQVSRPRPLDPVERLVLGSLGDDQPDVDAIRRSPLPAPLASRLVRKLTEAGLVCGDAGRGWSRTSAGKSAVRTGTVSAVESERQTLTFVERLDAGQRRIAPPHFVPLSTVQSRSWKPADDCAFSVEHIHDAIRRPAEWKSAFGFPADIVAGPASTRDWKRVPTVRAEHFLAILLETPDPVTPLKAFAIRAETMMPSPAPLFALPAVAKGHVPELFPSIPIDIRPGVEFELVGDGMVRCIRHRS
jgi:hypothetical protein